MKAFRKIFAAFTVLLICLSASTAAFAANDPEYYEGKTWEEVAQQVLADCNVSPDSVAAGYCNLVTGEEHYINGDTYLTSASMYKLPLNMYYAELLAAGQLDDWDVRFPYLPYEQVRDESLIFSDNDKSEFLYSNGIIDSYSDFRRITAPYMGIDFDNADPEYRDQNNLYTARQFIHCLKLLYDEQDNFPGIIDTMRQADIDRFFMLNEPRFKIAHKYGYITNENNITFMNDCALAFTSQPIAIVMFTVNVQPNAEELLTSYCTAMCEYTEYLAAKASATPEPTPENTPEPVPEPTPAPVEPAPIAESQGSSDEASFPILPLLFIALFALVGVVAVIVLSAKFKLSFIPLFLTLVFCSLAMLLALVGFNIGTVYAKPEGEPRQSVCDFFDGVLTGDYAKAYAQLKDYTSLGIEKPPSSESGKIMYDAVHASFSYELIGECVTDKLKAWQTVGLTYLDLPSLEADVSVKTQECLMQIVQSRPTSKVYDANKNYLPEVAEEAYLTALKTVLENAGNYYRTTEIRMELSYVDGRWKLMTNSTLLKALNGAVGY